MKKYATAALVGTFLVVGAAGCKNQETERQAAEAQKQAQEAELTAAKMKAESEEAAAKMRAAHTETRTTLQKDLDAHERKAAYLKERAMKLTGAQKKNAEAALNELTARQNAAKASMTRLGNDADPAWDATRKTAEDDVAAVGKAVDALEKVVNKK